MTVFALPDLGEGLEEAEIVAWHVTVGDRVVADQPLVSVETDKAVVEIPAPQAGRIERLYGEPGDIVKVGAPLAAFESGPAPDAGALVGELPNAAPEPRQPPPPAPERPRVKAAPAVRALAERLQVDLDGVRPSGPGGAITSADVEAASHPEPAEAEADAGAVRGARRAMARNMARARDQVAPASIHDEADVEAWASPTADVTVRLIRAVVQAARAVPNLNAWFDGERLTLRPHDKVDLGLAVDTPDGLLVPVLRHVGGHDREALRQAVDRVKTAAAARQLTPEDLGRPTITLSNFGLIVGVHAEMVVIPPQVAILGAGRLAHRVVVVGDAPAVRQTLPLSLTFDHRAVTGGEAARFLSAVIADLERDT